ncbi:MAG: DUF11 domain-containing protein [Anaerolineales bacterium]|nr:DUF11 domain-containing protein [Anaerolineales bacterium]
MLKLLLRLVVLFTLILPTPAPRPALANGLQADLSVLVLDAPDPVIAGADVAYELTVTNLGPAQAVNVTLIDTLPTGITFVSIDPTTGCGHAGGVITCTLSTLDSGASVSYTLTADVAPDTRGPAHNTATVGSAIADPDANNNTYMSTTQVEPEVDLRLTTAGSTPDPAVAGATLTYTFTIENLGRSLATGVILTDTLPSGQIGGFVAATPGFGCGGNGAVVTCTVGAVAPVGVSGAGWIDSGSVLTVSVTPNASLAGGALLFNSATIDAAEPEVSAGNNTVFSAASTVRRSDNALSLDAPTGPLFSATAITYTLSITNTGPSNDTGVVVQGTYTSGVLGLPVSDDPACVVASGQITCTIGALAAGAGRVFHFSVMPLTTSATTGTVDLTISGDNTEGDGASGPNQATVSIDFVPFRQWLTFVGRP